MEKRQEMLLSYIRTNVAPILVDFNPKTIQDFHFYVYLEQSERNDT